VAFIWNGFGISLRGVTIAACYTSREGVVLGADSTTTFESGTSEQNYYLNYSQKIFEIG
jgi:hypothetical protein